jgi:hypothetical protein
VLVGPAPSKLIADGVGDWPSKATLKGQASIYNIPIQVIELPAVWWSDTTLPARLTAFPAA